MFDPINLGAYAPSEYQALLGKKAENNKRLNSP